MEQIAARYLVNTLGGISGLPTKLAQILALRTGVDAKRMQEKSPPMPLQQVREIILRSHPGLSAALSWLEPEAKVASLAQVHRGRLQDGREIVVKVQFPKLREKLLFQLKMLLAAAKVSPAARFGMDFETYDAFLRVAFQHELDYLGEAARQKQFRDEWESISFIGVPAILSEFSNETLLVQEYRPALSLSEIEMLPELSRQRCAKMLTVFLLGSIFSTGRVHADLHPSNWGYALDSKQLVVYDFGSVVELKPEWLIALRLLILGSRRGSFARPPLVLFSELGFSTDKLRSIEAQLPTLCQSLFAPLFAGGPWRPSDWQVGENMERALGADKWWFRTAGPPWFFLVLRTISSVARAVQRLEVPVNVAEIFSTMVEVGETSSAQTVAPATELGPSQSAGATLSSGSAKNLRVSVREGGASVVELELPVQSIDNLEELISDETAQRIAEQGLSLVSIKRAAQASGYAPQTLFEAQVGLRNYKVYLG